MNRKDSVVKSTTPITVTFSDEDIQALSIVIGYDEIYPPTPAEMVKLLARGQMSRLLEGADQLKDLYQKYGKSPVTLKGAIR